jgi:hypothetical protein
LDGEQCGVDTRDQIALPPGQTNFNWVPEVDCSPRIETQAATRPAAGRPAKKETSLPEYSIRVLEAGDWPAWDRFVSQSPQGTLFHTSTWLLNNGRAFRIFGCFRKGSLAGGMAMEILGGRQAGHLYQTQYLGMVLPPLQGKYVRALGIRKNIGLALARRVQTEFDDVECHMSPDLVDVQAFDWAGFSVSVRYTYRLDLTNLPEVWRNMDDKRRNDIRRAQRAGVTTDAQATLAEILPLVENAYRRNGIEAGFGDLALKREQALRARNCSRCLVARGRSGEALAAVYLVWDARTAYYLLGGFDPAKTQRGAVALALWDAMRLSGEVLKLQRFDLLPGNIRLHERFFRGFGGRLTPRYSVTWEKPSLRCEAMKVFRRFKRLLLALHFH